MASERATSVGFDQTPHGARRHGDRHHHCCRDSVTKLNKAVAADRSPTACPSSSPFTDTTAAAFA
ncbi:hypothetical protein C4D60_Mb09t10380 [Musa balbisiana]|uniref:Uncharacterized protein n=1 Tax=Musa balbisiana TaxID=52838 RepID=A0A4S8IFH0_MUSBA|nr:hypothetical protein C4D60_Mb09t10380 [Musa balbisiana]